jgi:hypothetical protein
VNGRAKLICGVAALLLTADRILAPISEIRETPAAAATPVRHKAKSEDKSSELKSDSVSMAHRFDGTWRAAPQVSNHKQKNLRFENRLTSTIVVTGGTNAVFTMDITLTPTAGSWPDLPSPLNLSPLSMKWVSYSTSVTVTASTLRIEWSLLPQFTDWKPANIPLSYREKFTNDVIKVRLAQSSNPSTTSYTLNGNQLTLENGTAGKITYTRLK